MQKVQPSYQTCQTKLPPKNLLTVILNICFKSLINYVHRLHQNLFLLILLTINLPIASFISSVTRPTKFCPLSWTGFFSFCFWPMRFFILWFFVDIWRYCSWHYYEATILNMFSWSHPMVTEKVCPWTSANNPPRL